MAVKRLPMLAINAVIISNFGCGCDIYSHVCWPHGNVAFLTVFGCQFGAHVWDWLLEKSAAYTTLYILATTSKFLFINSIADEPLLTETRVRCIISL